MLDAYDFRARTLWPELGRFGQEDPAGTVDSTNRYQALGGRWTGIRDPYGLFDSGPMGADRSALMLARENERRVAAEACARDKTSQQCMGEFGRLSVAMFGDKRAEMIRGVGARQYGGTTGAIFVNGILNSRTSALVSGVQLSLFLKTAVDVLWNPSVGLFGDGGQLFFVNYPSLPDASTVLLVDELRERIRRLESGRTVTVYAHSQGAAITASALSFLSEDERSHVDVVSFGGAAWTFPSGVHSILRYTNIVDPVPMGFGGAAVAGGGEWKDGDRTVPLLLGPWYHPFETYLEALRERREEEEEWSSARKRLGEACRGSGKRP
jgi:hypothetical protein